MPRLNIGPRVADVPNKQGFYEIQWTERGRSRRVSTRQTTRLKALAFFNAWIKAKEEAEAEAKEPLPTSELIDIYQRLHASEHVQDLERLRYAERPLRAFFGHVRPNEVDDEMVLEYTRRRREGKIKGCPRPAADATIRRELEHLRAVYLFAVRNKRRTNVFPGDVPTIKMPAKSEPRNRVASVAELDALLAACPDVDGRLSRAHRFIAIARWTAARKESIETLTWNRVDLDKGMIDFRQEGRTRTKKRRVPVPIDPQLMPILRRAFAEKTSLFVLDHGGSIRKAFEAAAKRAGIEDIHPHVLRHSWATHAAERGYSPFFIATWMGDTVATVERNYMHRSPDYLRQAVAEMEESANVQSK